MSQKWIISLYCCSIFNLGLALPPPPTRFLTYLRLLFEYSNHNSKLIFKKACFLSLVCNVLCLTIWDNYHGATAVKCQGILPWYYWLVRFQLGWLVYMVHGYLISWFLIERSEQMLPSFGAIFVPILTGPEVKRAWSDFLVPK